MIRDEAACDDARSAVDYKGLYDQAGLLASFGAWECDLASQTLTWTDGVYDLFDLPRGARLYRDAIVDLYQAPSRGQMLRLRAETVRSGRGFSLDARIKTTAGADRWMRLTANIAYAHGRPCRLFGAKQDITHERVLWDSLRHLAERDSLTGLANRRVLDAQCRALAEEHEDDGGLCALVLVDLDHFKAINDRFGHVAGDECLREAAGRLRQAFADAILVARMGGDEFAVLLRAPLGRPQIAGDLTAALRVLCRPVAWQKHKIDLGASIGLALLDRTHRHDPQRLLVEADCALYVAKAAGRRTIRVFGGRVG